jgi:iron complex transport system substrate-binding protein
VRVVSLAPSNTEIIYALGAEKQLVAVTAFCDFPAAAKQLPRLPGWSTIMAKDVLAHKPDLALTSSICQDELKAELEAAGVRVVHFDPRQLSQVSESFIQVAKLLGVDGQKLSSEFSQGIQNLIQSRPAKRLRIYIEEWDKPPMAAGNWVPELIQAAGGEPFNRELGLPSAVLSWEELMEFDPEIVVYSICGLATRFDPAAFLKVEGWRDLNAAKTARVYSVDDSLFNRPGPRLVEGGRLLRALMEEQAGGKDCAESESLRRLKS